LALNLQLDERIVAPLDPAAFTLLASKSFASISLPLEAVALSLSAIPLIVIELPLLVCIQYNLIQYSNLYLKQKMFSGNFSPIVFALVIDEH
jgi:hypothetical protein